MPKKPALAATVEGPTDRKKGVARKLAAAFEGPNDLRPNNSTARVARFLDCSESTVRDWILRGLLPAGKAGRRRVVAREDVLAFIKRPGRAAA